jgi:hypothetical protein
MYRKMKEHAEIKWSEVARKAIMEYIREIKGRSSSRELRSALPPETIRTLKSVSVKEAKRMYEEIEAMEWKRMKSSTRTS